MRMFRDDVLQQAEAIRAEIETAAGSLDDSTASRCVGLYRGLEYDGELIPAGTRIAWYGALKRAAVDLWDREESDPANAPELWEDVAYKDGYRVIPETFTAGAAFSAGEIGYWEGEFYRAKNNGTVWTPAEYPDAWERVEI